MWKTPAAVAPRMPSGCQTIAKQWHLVRPGPTVTLTSCRADLCPPTAKRRTTVSGDQRGTCARSIGLHRRAGRIRDVAADIAARTAVLVLPDTNEHRDWGVHPRTKARRKALARDGFEAHPAPRRVGTRRLTLGCPAT